MNLSVGIVGLPNVGKSTLFNALLKKQQALAANYPFATIEPNVGIVAVPDPRLAILADVVKNEDKLDHLPPLKPATVEFVDIAGLVKGASEGAGLGNKFLSHIREVSVIAHVVRAFEDPNVIKEGSVDPKSDYQTIETELMLADLQMLENVNRKTQNSNLQLKIKNELEKGIPVRAMEFTKEEKEELQQLNFLSSKPEIIVLNVSESDYSPKNTEEILQKYAAMLTVSPANCVVISAQIESGLAGLTQEEQKEYLKDLGLEKSGLERLIQKAYLQLGLISFLTAGEKEVRAWTIQKGINAQMAAGEIHTDFIKKFIKAEVVGYEDFVQNFGWKGSREHGKARLEGKEYVMQDGDVVEFKIGS